MGGSEVISLTLRRPGDNGLRQFIYELAGCPIDDEGEDHLTGTDFRNFLYEAMQNYPSTRIENFDVLNANADKVQAAHSSRGFTWVLLTPPEMLKEEIQNDGKEDEQYG